MKQQQESSKMRQQQQSNKMKRIITTGLALAMIIAAAPLTAQAGSQPAEQTIAVNVNVARYAAISVGETVGAIVAQSASEFIEAPVTVLANFNYEVVMSSSNVEFLDSADLEQFQPPIQTGYYPYAVDGDGNKIFFLPFVLQQFSEPPLLGIFRVAQWTGGPWNVPDTFGGDPGVTAEFGIRILPFKTKDATSELAFDYPLAGSYSGDLILTLVEV